MTSLSAAAAGIFSIGGDLPVNRLGYGTMRLVGEGAWGEPRDTEEARRVLRRAVDMGVNLIDTADAYGPEIAERLICEALHPYPAGLVIATKGGITRQGPAKTEYVGRAGYLIQCVEMSLRRLRLERIELYQLHRIDPRTPLEESLGALGRMQEQGKIRHIGLSEVTPRRLKRPRGSCRSSAFRTATRWLTGVTSKHSRGVRSGELLFCRGIRWRRGRC
jgi:pyridoxine 4-dehydrogenase